MFQLIPLGSKNKYPSGTTAIALVWHFTGQRTIPRGIGKLMSLRNPIVAILRRVSIGHVKIKNSTDFDPGRVSK